MRTTCSGAAEVAQEAHVLVEQAGDHHLGQGGAPGHHGQTHQEGSDPPPPGEGDPPVHQPVRTPGQEGEADQQQSGLEGPGELVQPGHGAGS